MRTESIRLTINVSFGEIINEFQDRNFMLCFFIKKNELSKKYIRTLKRKRKKLQNNKDFILFNYMYMWGLLVV